MKRVPTKNPEIHCKKTALSQRAEGTWECRGGTAEFPASEVICRPMKYRMKPPAQKSGQII